MPHVGSLDGHLACPLGGREWALDRCQVRLEMQKRPKKEQGEETREIAAKSSTGKSAPSSPCFGTRVMPPCVRGPVGLGCYLNLDPSVIFFCQCQLRGIVYVVNSTTYDPH